MHKEGQPKAGHTIKARIERFTGLALADAVNVAIFVLTIISLFLAGAGVVVAVLTLKDAHDSGVEQQKALRDQTATFMQMQGILDQNIGVAKDQLGVLQTQNAREIEKASERPDVKLDIVCFSGSNAGDPIFALGLTGKDHPKSQTYRLRVENEFMRCSFRLLNVGKAALQDGYLRVKMFGTEKGASTGIGLKFEPENEFQPRSASEPWENSVNYVDVVTHYPLFPTKKSTKDMVWQWKIIVPKDMSMVSIVYEFGGSSYPMQENSIQILTPPTDAP